MEPITDRQRDLHAKLLERNTNIDIKQRWASGVDHHPLSEALMDLLIDLDWLYGNDYFMFQVGGDGDNGEHLMYLLDIFFDSKINDD